MAYAKVMNGLKAFKSKRPFPAKNWILKSNKTYILPTGFGFSFGTVTFVILILSIGFANNLLYVFAFLLVSMALTGMWMTNKNVDSVAFIDMHSDLVFAGEKNNLIVYLSNKNPVSSIYSFDLHIDPKQTREILIEKVSEIQAQQKVALSWIPPHRGHIKWPRLILQSRFPFKMLRGWKYFLKTGTVLVYPQKLGKTDLPIQFSGNSPESDTGSSENLELFRDFRPFQQTDSPVRIDWKKSLKHQRHLVKNFESSDQKKIIIDWNHTDFLSDFESKISQLALWIDICDKKSDFYSLRIKSFQTDFGRNHAHYRHCLDKLALLQEADVV